MELPYPTDRRPSLKRKMSMDDIIIMDSSKALKIAPLSMLPTPPMAKELPIRQTVEVATYQPTTSCPMTPAQHLVDLVPRDSVFNTPSPDTVASYLAVAELPEQTVAFAACILESLSSFFAPTWRKQMFALQTRPTVVLSAPSSPRPGVAAAPAIPPRSSARKTLTIRTHPALLGAAQKPDANLIVLAALSIAKSFLDDTESDNKWWCASVARHDINTLNPAQLSLTSRLILKDLDYDFQTFTPDYVEEMRTEVFATIETDAVAQVLQKGQPKLVLMMKGIKGLGGLMTPEPTPNAVDAKFPRSHGEEVQGSYFPYGIEA